MEPGSSSRYVMLLSIVVVIDFFCLFCGQIRKSGVENNSSKTENSRYASLLFSF